MIKRLLLLTAIFGFAVSCNDYEDDFANLNDQLNGVNAKLDNIQDAVDGIAEVQLELLNINSALAAITAAIGELPTVDDISNLSTLIGDTSASLSQQMDDLDADLQVVATNIITQLDAMKVMIEEGFAAIDVTLSALSANIAIVDGKIVELQTSVDENGNAIDANGNAILDLAGKVEIVDGKIVAVDGKLDNMLSNLTGQLGNMIDNITAQFATVNAGIDGVNGELDNIDQTLAANQAEALIWHMNTMAGIGRVEVDLVSIDDQNAQILQQLAGMLTVIEAGFTGMDTGFQNQSDELSAAQAAILAEVTIAQNGIAANLIEIQNLETLVGILQSTIDDNQDLIEQNGLDILANGLLIDRNNGNILLNGNAIDANGILINSNAAKIDANGVAIDGNGAKIDANGVKIDANGNAIDDNGDGIADNGTGIDDNGNDIAGNAATLLAITGLINSLQEDVDTVLENITTVYNGHLTISNAAELTYAITLQDKIAVVNGNVSINTTFASDATQVNSVIERMNILNTVTGDVSIVSTSALTANSLVSVGGDYSVTGNPVLTPAFVNAANNVTLYYDASADYVTSFTNIGKKLTIKDNSAATVDFSNVATVGDFSIVTAADVTVESNTLTDPTNVDLGAISNSDLASTGGVIDNEFTVNYTAAQTDNVSLKTDTDLNVTGSQDLVGLVADGNVVSIDAGAITGNVDIDAFGNASLTATSISNGTGGSITFDSDGQTIDVPTIVTGQFNIEDNGENNNANFTDIKYTSVTASSFSLLDNGTGNLNMNILTANLDATGSAWDVANTTITSNKKVSWVNAIPQLNAGGTVEVGMLHVDGVNGALVADKFPGGESANATTIEIPLYISGDLTVNINGNSNGFDMVSGKVGGSLDVNAKNNTNVQMLLESPYAGGAPFYFDEASSIAISGTVGNLTLFARYIDPAGTVTTTDGNARSSYMTYVNAPVDLTAPGNIKVKSFYISNLSVNVGGTAEIGQAANSMWIAGDFTATGTGSVNFIGNTEGASFGSTGFDINIGGDALINNYDFSQYSNTKGVSVIAGGEIQAQGFTELYGVGQGSSPEPQPYTFQAGGDIDLSNLESIGLPRPGSTMADTTSPRATNVSITSTSGDINLSSLTAIKTTADGTTIIDAGTGNVNTHELSTHIGSSLTIGGTLIMVEDLVSSTGDLTLSGDLVLENNTTTGASPLLATWNTLTVESDTLVQLPAHDDASAGAMTLTLAQTVSTNSITIAEVSAPAMTSLELTAQSTSFALVDGDFDSAAAGYVIDITGDATLDAMSFTGVSNLTGLTTAGNVDTFVADGNPLLATIAAGHVNVVGATANPLGTKLHLIDNVALLAYTSATSKMQEIIITGNTSLADLDLTSYLDNNGLATDDDTAFDGNTVNFIFNVTNNDLTGVFTPKDNSGTPDTSLLSDDLVDSGVKNIALHLLDFEQGNVDVVADFVGLTSDPDAFDTFNANTDFLNGITTIAEFELLVPETP